MKRVVEICSCVGDHLDFANLKLGYFGVELSRGFAAKIIADDRRGQAFVGDHSIFDHVAKIDQVYMHDRDPLPSQKPKRSQGTARKSKESLMRKAITYKQNAASVISKPGTTTR